MLVYQLKASFQTQPILFVVWKAAKTLAAATGLFEDLADSALAAVAHTGQALAAATSLFADLADAALVAVAHAGQALAIAVLVVAAHVGAGRLTWAQPTTGGAP